MIELFLIKPSEMTEIPVESITWAGQRYQAARKIEARIFYNKNGSQKVTGVVEGDTVLFKWKGKELFRGTVFKRSLGKQGILTLTAYDMLQYLILNKDVYVFSKKRADEILKRICKDFEIPMGTIVNTGYVLKSQVTDSERSLYDIALKPIIETEKQTKRKFQLSSKAGKVNLLDWSNPQDMWVLETGNNIEDFTYTTSIEESATRVKMVTSDEKKPKTAVVTDADGKKRYGILQHFERVTEKLNQAQLTQRANNVLSKKKGVKRDLDVEALGIPDIISGMPIHVSIPDISLKRNYYVDVDTHFFNGNHHSMSLRLIEKNDTPEVVS